MKTLEMQFPSEEAKQIRKFTVQEDGIYAFRNKLITGEWCFKHLSKGEKIEGNWEGCGPITWNVKEKQ